MEFLDVSAQHSGSEGGEWEGDPDDAWAADLPDEEEDEDMDFKRRRLLAPSPTYAPEVRAGLDRVPAPGPQAENVPPNRSTRFLPPPLVIPPFVPPQISGLRVPTPTSAPSPGTIKDYDAIRAGAKLKTKAQKIAVLRNEVEKQVNAHGYAVVASTVREKEEAVVYEPSGVNVMRACGTALEVVTDILDASGDPALRAFQHLFCDSMPFTQQATYAVQTKVFPRFRPNPQVVAAIVEKDGEQKPGFYHAGLGLVEWELPEAWGICCHEIPGIFREPPPRLAAREIITTALEAHNPLYEKETFKQLVQGWGDWARECTADEYDMPKIEAAVESGLQNQRDVLGANCACEDGEWLRVAARRIALMDTKDDTRFEHGYWGALGVENEEKLATCKLDVHPPPWEWKEFRDLEAAMPLVMKLVAFQGFSRRVWGSFFAAGFGRVFFRGGVDKKDMVLGEVLAKDMWQLISALIGVPRSGKGALTRLIMGCMPRCAVAPIETSTGQEQFVLQPLAKDGKWLWVVQEMTKKKSHLSENALALLAEGGDFSMAVKYGGLREDKIYARGIINVNQIETLAGENSDGSQKLKERLLPLRFTEQSSVEERDGALERDIIVSGQQAVLLQYVTSAYLDLADISPDLMRMHPLAWMPLKFSEDLASIYAGVEGIEMEKEGDFVSLIVAYLVSVLVRGRPDLLNRKDNHLNMQVNPFAVANMSLVQEVLQTWAGNDNVLALVGLHKGQATSMSTTTNSLTWNQKMGRLTDANKSMLKCVESWHMNDEGDPEWKDPRYAEGILKGTSEFFVIGLEVYEEDKHSPFLQQQTKREKKAVWRGRQVVNAVRHQPPPPPPPPPALPSRTKAREEAEMDDCEEAFLRAGVEEDG